MFETESERERMKLGGEEGGEKLGKLREEKMIQMYYLKKNSKVKTITIKILSGIHALSFL